MVFILCVEKKFRPVFMQIVLLCSQYIYFNILIVNIILRTKRKGKFIHLLYERRVIFCLIKNLFKLCGPIILPY